MNRNVKIIETKVYGKEIINIKSNNTIHKSNNDFITIQSFSKNNVFTDSIQPSGTKLIIIRVKTPNINITVCLL